GTAHSESHSATAGGKEIPPTAGRDLDQTHRGQKVDTSVGVLVEVFSNGCEHGFVLSLSGISEYGCHAIDDEIDTRNGNTVAQCFVSGGVGGVRDVRPEIRKSLKPFCFQGGQAADQVGTFDHAFVLAHILVIDPMV